MQIVKCCFIRNTRPGDGKDPFLHVFEIASKILRQASKDSGGLLWYGVNYRAVDMNNISRQNFALLELSQYIKPSVGLLHYKEKTKSMVPVMMLYNLY